jgi:hypothetical protein
MLSQLSTVWLDGRCKVPQLGKGKLFKVWVTVCTPMRSVQVYYCHAGQEESNLCPSLGHGI